MPMLPHTQQRRHIPTHWLGDLRSKTVLCGRLKDISLDSRDPTLVGWTADTTLPLCPVCVDVVTERIAVLERSLKAAEKGQPR